MRLDFAPGLDRRFAPVPEAPLSQKAEPILQLIVSIGHALAFFAVEMLTATLHDLYYIARRAGFQYGISVCGYCGCGDGHSNQLQAQDQCPKNCIAHYRTPIRWYKT
jgi:hypothetical protein